MAMKKETMASLIGRYHGLTQDIDSIKHAIRQIKWRIDAIIAKLGISVEPNVLEEIISPSPSFLNKIVTDARQQARFVGTAEHHKPKRKVRRRKHK